jgi:hypothetical protein
MRTGIFPLFKKNKKKNICMYKLVTVMFSLNVDNSENFIYKGCLVAKYSGVLSSLKSEGGVIS